MSFQPSAETVPLFLFYLSLKIGLCYVNRKGMTLRQSTIPKRQTLVWSFSVTHWSACSQGQRVLASATTTYLTAVIINQTTKYNFFCLQINYSFLFVFICVVPLDYLACCVDKARQCLHFPPENAHRKCFEMLHKIDEWKKRLLDSWSLDKNDSTIKDIRGYLKDINDLKVSDIRKWYIYRFVIVWLLTP